MNRVIPHDLELERAVLGAVILDNRLGSVVCGDVNGACFYDIRNRFIFDAICDLVEASEPIDAVTIHGRLFETAKKSDGMAYYLSTLTDAVPTVQRVEDYIAKLKEIGKRRLLIELFASLSDMGYKESISTDEFFLETRQTVTAITDGGEDTRAEPIKDISADVYKEILSKEPPKGLVKTGINAIDSEYGGLWPGVVTMLAARPSMGKSALALTVLANAALAGKKVLFFSLEDTKRFVMMRLFARFADVNLGKLINRNLNFDEVKRLEGAKEILDCLPITVDDTSAYTPQSLRGRIQRKLDTDGVDLVVIDHLLHIKGSGNGRYEQITDAAEQTTQMLKECGIANLVLHQLNRENVKRENKTPTLSDLRGSGDIEQLIRVAWFLHREHYYSPEEAPENDATLLVAKNSHGPTGSVGLHCNLSRMVFTDKEERF